MLILNYKSKKELKEQIGRPLDYTETSMFGPEYKPDGVIVGSNRPHTTNNEGREFLFSKGVTQFKLVSSLGATEAYPFTGSSEIITDITSSGETLRANNLRILKDGEILKSEACMMASKSSLKNSLVKKLVKLLSK